MSATDIKNPVILVTGANRGIGHYLVTELHRAGHLVIGTARSKEKIKHAQSDVPIPFELLDSSSGESVNQLAKKLQGDNISIRCLINNAAVLSEPELGLTQNSESAISRSLQTNSLGPLRLTRALLPLMTAGSQVIMVSSGAGAVCGEQAHYAPLYSISKSLLNAITIHLAHELKQKDIRVNAVCPGWVRTKMGGRTAPRSVEKGTETILWLVNQKDPKLTGMFFRDKEQINW